MNKNKLSGIYKTSDVIFYSLCLIASISLGIAFLLIIFKLSVASITNIHQTGWHFLITETWDPVHKIFGALGCIKGTLISSFIALVIGVPASFGIVIFIMRIAPTSIRSPLRIMIDLLAGIPSIILGMWGLFILAPIVGSTIQPKLLLLFQHHAWAQQFFQGTPFGLGPFTAGLILSLMIIPFISSNIYDVFELVPNVLQESSAALGATTWETIRQVMIPYGKTSLIACVMLGLGRAMGETMAVSFVIGNAHTLTTKLFMPSNSITSTLANEFTEAHHPLHLSALVELGLILFLITATSAFISQMLLKYTKRKHPGDINE